jgi:glyoxylase-like metal-dependent hydrolase (beta-lactamase superfamily II)
VDLYEYFGAPRTPFTVDETVTDGEVRALAGIPFLVRSTPGHTTGCACYILESERVIFTGDTLFAGTIGRTDFPTGSMSELRESLRGLGSLQGDYTVYAGHNEDTTLEAERKSNPFLAF